MRILILMLLASPCFAQCQDSASLAKDSIISEYRIQSAVYEEREQNWLQRFDAFERQNLTLDSLNDERLSTEIYYSETLRKERPLMFTVGALAGVALALIVTTFIHTH